MTSRRASVFAASAQAWWADCLVRLSAVQTSRGGLARLCCPTLDIGQRLGCAAVAGCWLFLVDSGMAGQMRPTKIQASRAG